MLSFSTCWNSARHTEGAAMLEEIQELGFSHIELSHGISVALLPGIQQKVNRQEVNISGVHNYFPAPIDLFNDAPDRYEFTSYKEEERVRALKLSLNSLEQAAELGASYLVLHLGTAMALPRAKCTQPLTKLVQTGQANSPLYAETKAKIVETRHKLSPLYYERAKYALDKLLPKAQEYKITLAIEGRSHYEQVPNTEELRQLLTQYKGEPYLGYWHDFGHIGRQENLLFLNHRLFLEEFSPFLVGAHVNDLKGVNADHQIPFEGKIKFPELIPSLPGHLPFVWELSSQRKAEDIKRAREEWERLFPHTLEVRPPAR